MENKEKRLLIRRSGQFKVIDLLNDNTQDRKFDGKILGLSVTFEVEKVMYKLVGGLFFILLLSRLNAFGQVTFTITMHFRTIFVDAVILDDVGFTNFIIQEQYRDDHALEKHETRQREYEYTVYCSQP